MTDSLDDCEQYLMQQVGGMADSDTERMVAFVATVGAHRWGIDLENPAGEQEYGHLEDAMADAMDDLAAEGKIPMVGEAVIDSALELVDVIEELEAFDVHEPGPLVERVEMEETQ